MEIREPVCCQVALAGGGLTGATGRYAKKFGELAGLYADARAFDAMARARAGEVVYEVAEFRPGAAPGDLIFGITRMAPGKVGGEYFMTRGHLHAVADRPEVYYGQRGCGVMLMESPAGEIRTAVIQPQSICYVPPYWIHRSVNTGAGDLVMMFTYPADAGQDYGIILRSGGMRMRVVDDGGGWKLIANPDYRPRPAEAVAALLLRQR
jgi:glucose-6-phosphate isomerase